MLRKLARAATGVHLMESQDDQIQNHLPSPSESVTRGRRATSPLRKEKRRVPSSEHEPAVKRRKQEPVNTILSDDLLDEPILHWILHDRWPPASLGQIPLSMSRLASTTKRKSESPHRSDRLQRLSENGIFMRTSTHLLKSSKDMCGRYLRESRDIGPYTMIPPNRFMTLLERVAASNEARLRRDVMPWVVPSAENLYLCGEMNRDYIGDAVDADWTRCATMGSTRPKPDYCAGLLPCAYTPLELAALRAYASPQRPVFFTPEMSFPFLMCEVKTGETGLNQADRQNIHSASIAVRAIVELYKAAFGTQDPARVTDLYGQILVFSVSHDNDRAQVYGHYCVLREPAGDELDFYRYPLTLVSLSAADGADKDRVYSFTRNVYDHFVPEHLHRIKAAASCLPAPLTTGLSFSTSELGIREGDSHEIPASEAAGFTVPGTPASTIQSEQVTKLRQQMEQQKKQMEQQKQQMELQKQQILSMKDELHRLKEGAREIG